MELLKELKEIIDHSSDEILNSHEEKNGYRINTRNGAVIHCYRTGKVLFQGKQSAKQYLEKLWEKHKESSGFQDTKVNNVNSDIEREKNDAFGILSAIKLEYIFGYLHLEREKKLNENNSLLKNEDELKEWFIKKFKKWFIIHENIAGKGYVNKKKFLLEADFILEPRQELIDKGITSFLGVEVKYINICKNYFPKTSELCFQALSYSYSNSEWLINNSFTCVDGFIIFTNLSFLEEREIFNTLEKYKSWWSAHFSLINHANVGELRINRNKNMFYSWYLSFSGNNYCKWDKNSGVLLRNPKVIGKSRIGNIG